MENCVQENVYICSIPTNLDELQLYLMILDSTIRIGAFMSSKIINYGQRFEFYKKLWLHQSIMKLGLN